MQSLCGEGEGTGKELATERRSMWPQKGENRGVPRTRAKEECRGHQVQSLVGLP